LGATVVLLPFGFVRTIETGKPLAESPLTKLRRRERVKAVPGVALDGPVSERVAWGGLATSKVCRLYAPIESSATACSVTPSADHARPEGTRLVEPDNSKP